MSDYDKGELDVEDFRIDLSDPKVKKRFIICLFIALIIFVGWLIRDIIGYIRINY